MSHDALSPEQFGFLPWKQHVSEEVLEAGVHPWETGEMRTIPLSRGFRSSQAAIDPAAVEHYAKNPRRPYQGGYHPPPNVAEHKGELVVLTGHHRIAAAMKRGQKTMRMGYQRGAEE
jgi:hypothetical protein